MRKPHEQDLSVHPLESRAVINEEGLVVADIREPLSTGGREFSELFAAAPDMARALMGRSGKGHDAYNPQRDEYACHWCAHFAPGHADGCECGSSLKKAGVL